MPPDLSSENREGYNLPIQRKVQIMSTRIKIMIREKGVLNSSFNCDLFLTKDQLISLIQYELVFVDAGNAD